MPMYSHTYNLVDLKSAIILLGRSYEQLLRIVINPYHLSRMENWGSLSSCKLTFK